IMEEEKKWALILKASDDICGAEMGLIENQFKLLGIEPVTHTIKSTKHLKEIIEESATKNLAFNYVYLCTHGNSNVFQIDFEGKSDTVTWADFGSVMCNYSILNDDTIFLLACCKGGLFQVAVDIMSVCGKINFVCGVKWTVSKWDLTTGFIVFIYNMVAKRAEPTYAAEKASLATDYTFACYDRDEVESNPQYQQRQSNLFFDLGWINGDGEWIETDQKIISNVGEQVVQNLVKP
ncbi:MAG: hypothetical protein IT234_05285, partial [Bacteroidia bacterium]|nr:hypothetical protein [Bacteroidia bacterium]